MPRKYEDSNIRHSSLYYIWGKMKFRCCNPKYCHYEYYGGRGIKVCDEWKKDFMAFYNWAMCHGYEKSLTIDRIDVNGNYCPENCRWVTKQIQSINRRKFKKNKSGYVGIYKDPDCYRWCSSIRFNRKSIHLGSFKTQKEALAARNNYIIAHGLPYAIQEYIGEICVFDKIKKLSVRNTSGYSGICFDKRSDKWVANVSTKRIGRGYFTQKEALEARNKYIIDNNLDYPIQEYKGELGSVKD